MEVPDQIYDFNIFNLKSQFKGKEIIKFYDHECDAFFYQCGDMRVCSDTVKEALYLFRNYDRIILGIKEAI